MDPGEARRILEEILGDASKVPVVRLPMRGRRVDRLIARLEPYRAQGLVAWILCTQLGCNACISREPYKVERGLTTVYDRLSGLRHPIPWARGVTGSGEAWRLEWRGDIYEVAWTGCGAKLGSKVECIDQEVCRGWAPSSRG
ncbi:MAG: hypothetical protein GSR84_00140 [Desulfurococcales archaeon]|nr:hypothetical protein [Desulfurococcales archaeon]